MERVVKDVTPAPWPRARLPLPRDEIVNSDGKGPPAIVVGERQRDRRVRPTRRAERAAIQFACGARLASRVRLRAERARRFAGDVVARRAVAMPPRRA